ncbi:SDR family NAD(P)-dependent oxidoreductase [Wolbachia endosymbiont of Chironomus riparius]|uniref:SDR family NAD(P)-dependent oxidoreductase n=1 Tax=Wolbachia endosymbiont of Chironomus riparius TaxID=2883238 RepID=UPI00209DA2CE|nr:SDR family oxidoreductase [Wolbachia endosymbiont of Chironomus riparius]
MGKLLEGKIALITGASGKIGSTVAKRFIREGSRVILVSRFIETLNALYNEIKEFEEFKDESVTLIQLDLLDFTNVKLLANKITDLKSSEPGGLDILVSCTEILGELTSIQNYELETFKTIMDTNFISHWYLLKNLDPILKKSNAGRIVFLTSEVTLSPGSYPYWGAYAASKAALETMVKVYASEIKGDTELRVNAVYLQNFINNKDAPELELSTDKFMKLVSDDCKISGEIFSIK